MHAACCVLCMMFSVVVWQGPARESASGSGDKHSSSLFLTHLLLLIRRTMMMTFMMKTRTMMFMNSISSGSRSYGYHEASTQAEVFKTKYIASHKYRSVNIVEIVGKLCQMEKHWMSFHEWAAFNSPFQFSTICPQIRFVRC